jgi:solute carrier family 25 protein 42
MAASAAPQEAAAAAVAPPAAAGGSGVTSSLRELACSSTLRHLVCGAAAGAAAKTVTAPLDRLKLIFQVSSQRFTLAAGARALAHTVAAEGAPALWRGHSATLLRIVPYAGLHYAAHEALEEALLARRAGARGGDDGRRRDAGQQQRRGGAPSSLSATDRFAAGAGAGAAATLVTYPLDVLRAQLVVAPPGVAGGAVTGARLRAGVAALRQGGVAAAFRGLGPTLAGIVPYSGVTWLAYTTLRERAELAAAAAASADAPQPASWLSPQLRTLAAGAVAGLVGQSATYPLDVARRRMQVGGAQGEGGALAVLARAVRAEGAAVLFKGLSLNWFKGPVATAVSFAAFEALSRRMRDATAAV